MTGIGVLAFPHAFVEAGGSLNSILLQFWIENSSPAYQVLSYTIVYILKVYNLYKGELKFQS